jgi:hypothetical protein
MKTKRTKTQDKEWHKGHSVQCRCGANLTKGHKPTGHFYHHGSYASQTHTPCHMCGTLNVHMVNVTDKEAAEIQQAQPRKRVSIQKDWACFYAVGKLPKFDPLAFYAS